MSLPFAKKTLIYLELLTIIVDKAGRRMMYYLIKERKMKYYPSSREFLICLGGLAALKNKIK